MSFGFRSPKMRPSRGKVGVFCTFSKRTRAGPYESCDRCVIRWKTPAPTASAPPHGSIRNEINRRGAPFVTFRIGVSSTARFVSQSLFIRTKRFLIITITVSLLEALSIKRPNVKRFDFSNYFYLRSRIYGRDRRIARHYNYRGQ